MPALVAGPPCIWPGSDALAVLTAPALCLRHTVAYTDATFGAADERSRGQADALALLPPPSGLSEGYLGHLAGPALIKIHDETDDVCPPVSCPYPVV